MPHIAPDPAPDTLPETLFHRPVHAKVPLIRALGELPRLLRADAPRPADIARATWELALAHRTLRRHSIKSLGLLRSEVDCADAKPLTAPQRTQTARVSRAIEIAAPRVPWRSDCLVQCLAGRRWLAQHGIAARIAIGIRRDEAGAMLAHAWLCADDIVVTGGDVADFAEFQASARARN
ncbi:Microcin J25-processing protein McjB C-terminal domain-containing protein [Novosphingobium lubricantis]